MMRIHRLSRLAPIVLCAMLLAPVERATAEEAQTDLIHRLLPTVVSLTVRREASKAQTPSAAGATAPTGDAAEDKTEYGSGFLVDPSGVIATNFHVVENAWEVVAGLSDGTRAQAKLFKATRLVDVALLKIDVGHPLPAVTWGDSDRLQVGESVMVVGNPFGVGISVTGGIVSALNRDISDSPYDDFIQTDAALNHGNSGGPLFDMQGRVVGMATALISPTKASTGLGFAIPARSTQAIIGRLEQYGWLRPSWVGMKVQQVSLGMARAFGLPKTEGSIVANVTPDGPADQGGLAIGDIIMRANDETPPDERALLRTVVKTPIGQPIRLTVLRDGHEQVLSITAAEWPKEQWDLVDRPVSMPPFRPVAPDLGLAFDRVTAETTEKFGLADPRPGVLVTGVAGGTDAADRGLVPGDIVMRVMGNDVSAPADVERGIAAARAAGHDFVAMLVWPKVRAKPGPEWVALRVAAAP